MVGCVYVVDWGVLEVTVVPGPPEVCVVVVVCEPPEVWVVTVRGP